MKLWQISAVLGFEREIFLQYFGNIDIPGNGQVDVDEYLIVKALENSKLKYYVTSHNYLRLYPDSQPIQDLKPDEIKPFNVLEAYKKYGGDAITQVMDYGSWQIR